MATPSGPLVQHLRRLVSGSSLEAASDAALLERFVRSRDEEAFAALVARHAAMVFSVCRRILRDGHAAEDALQATFVVLARKAAAIRRPASLAAWLHRTAHRLALAGRREEARRRSREERSGEAAPGRPTADPLEELSVRELLAVIDEEVQRLPEAYRLAVTLCCLQGRTQEEAARQLGWTPGSLQGRLERGRFRLRARLARRGLSLTAVLAAVELSRQPGLSAGLLAATVQAATDPRPGAGAVAALANGGLPVARLKVVLALLLGLGVAAGMGVLGYTSRAPEPAPAAATASPETGTSEPARARRDRYGDPLPAGAVARLGTAQLRQAGAWVLCFSRDGKTVTSVGSDQRLRVWDVASGRLIGKRPALIGQPGHARPALSHDGTVLLWYSVQDQSLVRWSVGEGKLLGKIPWAAAPQDQPKRLALSPDHRLVAAPSREGIELLDALRGEVQRTLRVKGARIGQPVFAPNGKILADAGGFDSPICLWDVSTGKLLRRIPKVKGEGENAVAFCADGKHFATGGYGQMVRLWRLDRDAALARLRLPLRKDLSFTTVCLGFTPDGKRLVAGGGGRPLLVWDVATRREIGRLPDEQAQALVFSPDSKTVATSGMADVHLWDLATGKELQPREGHTAEVTSVIALAGGKRIASGCYSKDYRVRLWDVATGRQEQVLAEHTAYIRDLSASADGRLLVSGSGDNLLCLWDTASGKLLRRFSFPQEEKTADWVDGWQVFALRLAADGKTLAAVAIKPGKGAQDHQLCAWDVATGKLLSQRAVDELRFCCFSADAKTLLVVEGTSGCLALLDVASGKRRILLRPTAQMWPPLAFSADERRIATLALSGPDRGQTVVCDTAGEARTDLPTGVIGQLAFSPDGRYLATVGKEDLRLWELATGQEVLRRVLPDRALGIFSNSSFAAALTFATDGEGVYTGLPDSTILLWHLAPDEPALAAAGKELTAGQIQHLWDELGRADARGYAACWKLAHAPARQVVPFIEARLPPSKGVDAARVHKLLTDLDSDEFSTRRSAFGQLEALGDEIQAELQKALKDKPPLEARKRLEELLAHGKLLGSGDGLRAVHAVEVLERLSTPAAWQVIRRWSRGAPEARLTREANRALERRQPSRP